LGKHKPNKGQLKSRCITGNTCLCYCKSFCLDIRCS